MSEPGASSMADVAARAKVSVSTVSRALRSSSLVSEQTRLRVLKAATELSFAVSPAAAALATGRLNRIAVLVGGRLRSWFNGSVLDALYEPMRAAGVDLVIHRITDAAERESFFTALPVRRTSDAMIVASFALDADERARLDELGIPLVYLNQRVATAPFVAIDDQAAGALATRHLIGLGHRKLIFVRGEGANGFAYSAIERLDGFRAETTKAGLDVPEQLIIRAEPDNGADPVITALLGDAERATGIVAESDEIAMSVITALGRVGLRVPDDLSVIGVDDHEMSERFGLTTIAQPIAELGRAAADASLRLAAGETVDEPALILPTRLVLRSSTRRA